MLYEIDYYILGTVELYDVWRINAEYSMQHTM